MIALVSKLSAQPFVARASSVQVSHVAPAADTPDSELQWTELHHPTLHTKVAVAPRSKHNQPRNRGT